MKLGEAKSSIGKEVFDIRGRKIGRLICFYANLKGEPSRFLIELASGGFLNCSGDQLQLKNGSLTYVPSWELEANALKNRFETASKRVKALDELYVNGEIEKEIYLELKARHENSMKALEERKASLMEKLSARKKKLESQIKGLEIFLANCKMQQASGEISDEAFRIALESIKAGLRMAVLERNYVKDMMDFLENIKASSSASLKPAPLKIEQKNQDIVMVKVKELV